MTPPQHAKVLEALESCKAQALHGDGISMDEWKSIDEALSIMRAEGVGEPQGWKLIGWTCGDGDCGRIHDARPDDDEGYMQPVYVMSAPPIEPTEVKP